MFTVRDLNIRYHTGSSVRHVVRGVSFAFGSGVAFGLVGRSGCGKSTLLRALAGLNADWDGEIVIDGAVQAKRRPRSFYRKVQMVFQDPYGSLHPRKTVDDSLAAPLSIHGFDDIDRRISAALDDVGLDQGLRFRYPHQLSGGQRQRVALARALVLEPKALLLDEPTASLDAQTQSEILRLLKALRQRLGLTMLLVSHNIAVVAELCDWFAVLDAGRLVEIVKCDHASGPRPTAAISRALLTAAAGYRPTTSPQSI